jgi:hypothetical protein
VSGRRRLPGFGPALEGRQGIKAGGPRQSLAIALPAKAEAVIGLCHNPCGPKKFPIVWSMLLLPESGFPVRRDF